MGADIAISLKTISKCYRRYRQPTDRLKEILLPGKNRAKEFWALRDVSLDIYKGETVGIVGRNGAGKSTLLQIICGTLKPTSGDVTVNGRVSALLGMGTGFNKEFTGRENVFMNAAVLGLSRQGIEKRFDAIAAFAEIGDFLDQPVKTYSTGMRARLAFAVAINIDPDILIVDEALAVGDEAFRRKCFSRIEQIRENGSTVLFVSHSAGQVVQLCNRAVLLNHGRRLLTGQAKIVTNRYQKLVHAPPAKQAEICKEIQQLDNGTIAQQETLVHPKKAVLRSLKKENTCQDSNDERFDPNLKPKSTIDYVQQGATISNPRILNQAGKQVNILKSGRWYIYTYDVTITKLATKIRCGMLIKTTNGTQLGGIVTHPRGKGLEQVNAGTVLQVRFKFHATLNPGAYFLNAGVSGRLEGEDIHLHRLLDAVMFKIEPMPDQVVNGYIDFSSHRPGLIEVVSDLDCSASLATTS